jgi:hypothetical protein
MNMKANEYRYLDEISGLDELLQLEYEPDWGREI